MRLCNVCCLFIKRTISVRIQDFKSKSLQFSEYGPPLERLTLIENDNVFDSNSKVLIKLLAAPINPSDINKIEGHYPHNQKLPAIGGGEGVGKVVAVGQNQKFKVGEKVIFLGNSVGTWRNYGIFEPHEIYKIPPLPTIAASMLLINPCTAYSLLKNIINFKPGEVIIQNGANSAVGQFVIQLAHIFGINTLNIIRNRPGVDELIGYLQRLGANSVILEEELNTIRTKDIITKFGNPRLALNCVGGTNCLHMIQYLQNNGILVTYGGMSKKPVILPTKYLIFKNIKAIGFFFSSSYENNLTNFDHMIIEICKYFNTKLLTLPHYKTYKLDDYKNALTNSLLPYNNNKSIFLCD